MSDRATKRRPAWMSGSTLWFLVWGLWTFLGLLPVGAQDGAESPRADVVVIVDTSVSMREPGMDPERTSLLVTQLLADIVPGELAAVRLLDLVADGDLLPSAATGKTEPCPEDPSRTCKIVEPASDWRADARTGLYGVLQRPRQGDEAFAQALDGHLEQRIHNSPFDLAFAAALGVFDRHRGADGELRRTVIWLSDGRADDPVGVLQMIREMRADDVGVEAVVFGRGDTTLAKRAGLEPRRTSGPADLMRAFAGAFRRIVDAPYEIDARIADRPSFTMQPAVDEAWVVVYGDAELGEVTVVGPGGERHKADAAARRKVGAGAYKVAHWRAPAPGIYTVEAAGGGPDVAYAVVQRSSLKPALVEPAEAIAGAETVIEAQVVAGREAAPVTDRSVLESSRLSVEVDGQSGPPQDLELQADGRFRGSVRFIQAGPAEVRLHLQSPVVDRVVAASVQVTGFLKLRRTRSELDLGTLTVDEEVCRPLVLDADHQGQVPVIMDEARSTPADHHLFLRSAGDDWNVGETRPLTPLDALEVCLRIGSRAPSSSADGEPWLRLQPPSGDPLLVHLRWTVHGLGFWARWGRLILGLVGLAVLLFVIAGFVWPQRFPPGLALTFVDTRDEVDEQQPQPLRQWKGVRIGFYRHARAYLHESFRVSGKARGALAMLVAERGGARVLPAKGVPLSRETLDGEWEPVQAAGRRVRAGDVYRMRDSGPFFRVATRGGRR